MTRSFFSCLDEASPALRRKAVGFYVPTTNTTFGCLGRESNIWISKACARRIITLLKLCHNYIMPISSWSLVLLPCNAIEVDFCGIVFSHFAMSHIALIKYFTRCSQSSHSTFSLNPACSLTVGIFILFFEPLVVSADQKWKGGLPSLKGEVRVTAQFAYHGE